MKFLPRYSQENDKIGVLGMVSSNGKIYFYNLPCSIPDLNKKDLFKRQYEIEPILEVSVPQTALTSFDYVNNSKVDQILCGDVKGNIYLIQVTENGNYSILKQYFQAHQTIVTRISLYPYNRYEKMENETK